MERALLDSQLIRGKSGSLEFALAAKADEAEIRRLLRANPTRGQIAISLEREPDYFADACVPGEAKQTVIARENGRLVCVGSCAVRRRFVNGQFRRVGYLGGLRLDAAVAGRFDIVRRGYAFFREIESADPADFYFTSIAADNERARRLLERGLPGMPRYEFLTEFVSLVTRTAIGRDPLPSHSCVRFGPESISHINEQNRLYQFSPHWSPDEVGALETLGLEDFVALESEGRITAGAALWDQRNFKQTVIRGYSPALAMARPTLNVTARILGQPELPAPNTILANALVTQLAADPDKPGTLVELVRVLQRVAAQKGMDLLTLGFAANDPRLAIMRAHFRRREYLTRLYLVRWPELGGGAAELDTRILAPDIALL